ncbi:MAG: YdcF family protein [Deltaproteobacteria bacterium]|nr:YdcF family protein [Deltaproteobacteria bacterium]MBW2321538.1 YdcF family protein [Deltaproteobacteria bacterium]
MNDTIELLVRTLCDLRPMNPTNGAYLYCQTRSNQQSIFKAAQSLLNNSLTYKILILNTKAKSGYPGFTEWKQQLEQLGIPEKKIEGVIINKTTMLNTLIESEGIIRFAKQHSYNSVFVVAPPFQQLRAFMTAVTVALREYPELLIYSYPGAAMSWQEEVVHSQGTLKAKRRDLIQEELERIDKYHSKGNLASPEQVLSYLNKRNTAF